MNAQVLSFFCLGTPAPGGSKNFFPTWTKDGRCVTKWKGGREWPVIRVVDAGGAANVQWKKDVANQARSFMRGQKPFEGALKVELLFFLRRPRTHYRTGKFAALLKGDAPVHHTQMPDALKLGRSTEDALTGVLWIDDAQNVRICPEKRWANPGEPIGCRVTLVVL